MNLRKFNKNLKKEYTDTFYQPKIKKERKFTFKIRYALLCLGVLLVFILIGEHIGTQIYNQRMENRENQLVLETSNGQMNRIQSEKELNAEVRYFTAFSPRKSILSKIFSMSLIGCGSGNTNSDDFIVSPTSPSYDANESNTQYNTNIQTEGIDEADTVKCDGTYIYALIGRQLSVYDLNGACIAQTVLSDAEEMYVYENKIAVFGNLSLTIFSLENGTLTEEYNQQQGRIMDTRLSGNILYIVVQNKLEKANISYENLYYDGCINPYYVYTIIRYDLTELSEQKVQSINSYSMQLYISQKHIYLASNNYLADYSVTYISIFDFELNPVGVVRVCGSILNQFFMDEYNNTLRVVSTDTTQPDEKINALSIFDISTLERVGYLNQGIGIDRQIVKSVRFNGSTCYVVTYLNQDPLYEIDCSDVSNPVIVSRYEAPGYSEYLHTFTIDGEEYVLGLGYTDYRENKISVYKNGEQTQQIGTDLILLEYYSSASVWGDKNSSFYQINNLYYSMFDNHKALFIHNDGDYLYLGLMVGEDQYTVFKIDVKNSSQPITVYQEFDNLITIASETRGLLIENKFYLPVIDKLEIYDWN